MQYIESDGSPQSYLEATVFEIEVSSFAEYWHSLSWYDTMILDSKPRGTYTYVAPEPVIWSPTVRISGTEAEVTLHTFGQTSAAHGINRLVVVFPLGTYAGTWVWTELADVPISIQY